MMKKIIFYFNKIRKQIEKIVFKVIGVVVFLYKNNKNKLWKNKLLKGFMLEMKYLFY